MRSKCILILLLGLILNNSLSAKDIPWDDFKDVYDNPKHKFSQISAMTENVPLVAKSSDKIPPIYFAIASVLRHFEISGQLQYPFLDAPISIVLKPELIYGLMEDYSKLDKKFIDLLTNNLKKYFNDYRKKAILATEKFEMLLPTNGQLLTALLYESSPNDPNMALKKIQFEHFYIAKYLRKIDANEQVARVLLNIGVPFILEDNNVLKMCVGFWQEDRQTFFIVANLNNIAPINISKKDFYIRNRISMQIDFSKISSDEYSETLVKADTLFNPDNEDSYKYFEAITMPQKATMFIVNKPTFNEELLKQFLKKQVDKKENEK